MNEIPQGWSRATLGELADTQLGKMLSPKSKTGSRPKPYLRNRDVRWGGFDLANLPMMDFTEAESAKFCLRPGDVVVCEGGEVGRAAIWRLSETEVHFQKALHRVRCSSALMPEYLFYLLRHYSYSRAFDRHVTGSTIEHLPQEDLRRLPIPLPPLDQQRRIVEVIEENFSRLDAADNALRRSLAMIEALQAACFSTVTHVFAAPDLDDEHPDLPLPEGWHWMRASDVCYSIDSGSTPRADKMHRGAGDIPFLKVYNITMKGLVDFCVKPTFIDSSTHRGPLARSRVVPGDVLMNIVGPPLGKIAVVPETYAEWNINQAIVAFRLKPSLNSRFLSYCLMSKVILRPLLRTGKATAGQTNLSLSNSRRLWLPVPPETMQAELVEELGHQLSVYDNVASTIHAARRRSAQLRQAILHRAFSGKLPIHVETNDNDPVARQPVLA